MGNIERSADNKNCNKRNYSLGFSLVSTVSYHFENTGKDLTFCLILVLFKILKKAFLFFVLHFPAI